MLAYGTDKNEQQIVVKSDPRILDNPENIESIYNASKKLESFMAKTSESVKQLTQSKNILLDYQKLFKENKTESVKGLTKEIKTQTKALDSLISLYIGKVDKRQGIVRNSESNVMTRIGTASRYIRTRKKGITTTEDKLLQHAKDELEAALEKTNKYYKEVWPYLRTQIEGIDSSRFKEIKQIDLE